MSKSKKPTLKVYDEKTYGETRVMLQTDMYSEKELLAVIDSIRKMNKANKQAMGMGTDKVTPNEKV